MITGIASMLAFGAVWIAVIAWLCRRPQRWLRHVGALVAGVVACYCGGVALILILDNGVARPRMGGALAVVAFAIIAGAAIVSARRSLARP